MAGDAATPLLALERLEVAYGGIQAVRGIDLVVGRGELVCLIGANGAGKTTTLKGITGLQPVSGGTVRYEGEDVTGAPAFQLVRRGLAMVPEGRGVFGGLTIEQAAEALGISRVTAFRYWTYARAWLHQRIRGQATSS